MSHCSVHHRYVKHDKYKLHMIILKLWHNALLVAQQSDHAEHKNRDSNLLLLIHADDKLVYSSLLIF